MKKVFSFATIALFSFSMLLTSCRNDAGTGAEGTEGTEAPAQDAAPAEEAAPAQEAAPDASAAPADTTTAQ